MNICIVSNASLSSLSYLEYKTHIFDSSHSKTQPRLSTRIPSSESSSCSLATATSVKQATYSVIFGRLIGIGSASISGVILELGSCRFADPDFCIH